MYKLTHSADKNSKKRTKCRLREGTKEDLKWSVVAEGGCACAAVMKDGALICTGYI